MKHQNQQIIGRGAEAILIKKGNILVKKRVKKSYRHEQLDSFLRTSRTKHESKILQKALALISVPRVHRTTEFEIDMDFIKGKKLSDHLDNFSEKEAFEICKKIGQEVAKIHQANIIHGDLTTSNMIFVNEKKQSANCDKKRVSLDVKSKEDIKDINGQVFLIDFGLGFQSARPEDKAVDIHLLKEALESKHFKRAQGYFKKILGGYKWPDSGAVLKQLEKVEQRGRYKNKDKY